MDYTEFRHWWYNKKDGKPHMEKCPRPFLELLARMVQTQAYDTGEELVSHTHCASRIRLALLVSHTYSSYDESLQCLAYARTDGDKFGILIDGKVKVWRDHERANASNCQDESRATVISHQDREPVFGFMAILTKQRSKKIQFLTRYVHCIIHS